MRVCVGITVLNATTSPRRYGGEKYLGRDRKVGVCKPEGGVAGLGVQSGWSGAARREPRGGGRPRQGVRSVLAPTGYQKGRLMNILGKRSYLA